MESDRDILIRIDERTRGLHDELIGSAERDGRIPLIESKLNAHASQINFWRGAIAVIAALMVAFGGTLIAHVLRASGK